MIRQLGSGIYSYLPLAKRSLLKIERIVREEMEAIGAQEFYLPALHPAEVWQESGRWSEMGEILFKFKDRTGRDFCLGPTHEEVFTAIARNEVRSYRQLPQIWFQIQTKFRDEPRPKSGLLRVRQFTMKDSYSFDVDSAGLDRSYALHAGAYRTIYDRAGLQYVVVQAESGPMGGSDSEEFMVYSQAGEDWVVSCSSCPYAANLERANSAVRPVEDTEQPPPLEEVHTPGQRTIQEVSDYLQIGRHRQIKSLVYIVDSRPHLILMRGDHQLNESKLLRAVGTDRFRPAEPEEIQATFGADPGSLGPVGIEDTRVLADMALKGRRDLVCGANRNDYHLLHVTPGRDFECDFLDLREVTEGEPCALCESPLRVAKAIEVGHIFKLGNKYSRAMGATVSDEGGKEVPLVMGSYGIGIERILAAAIELYHDDNGIVFPRSIAPFEALVTVVRADDPKQLEAGENLYQSSKRQGIDTLLDDRVERPGVKFKDSELIGIPVRITVGRTLTEGKVELFTRSTGEKETVAVDEAVNRVTQILDSYSPLQSLSATSQ